eukprot:snap_masked-scaffold_1-processed-gene-10.23-mRNA-1 protein AED:1.00 eAED:1.00 QI:0/-1/0/0/-1/1/1/0/66
MTNRETDRPNKSHSREEQGVQEAREREIHGHNEIHEIFGDQGALLFAMITLLMHVFNYMMRPRCGC